MNMQPIVLLGQDSLDVDELFLETIAALDSSQIGAIKKNFLSQVKLRGKLFDHDDITRFIEDAFLDEKEVKFRLIINIISTLTDARNDKTFRDAVFDFSLPKNIAEESLLDSDDDSVPQKKELDEDQLDESFQAFLYKIFSQNLGRINQSDGNAHTTFLNLSATKNELPNKVFKFFLAYGNPFIPDLAGRTPADIFYAKIEEDPNILTDPNQRKFRKNTETLAANHGFLGLTPPSNGSIRKLLLPPSFVDEKLIYGYFYYTTNVHKYNQFRHHATAIYSEETLDAYLNSMNLVNPDDKQSFLNLELRIRQFLTTVNKNNLDRTDDVLLLFQQLSKKFTKDSIALKLKKSIKKIIDWQVTAYNGEGSALGLSEVKQEAPELSGEYSINLEDLTQEELEFSGKCSINLDDLTQENLTRSELIQLLPQAISRLDDYIKELTPQNMLHCLSNLIDCNDGRSESVLISLACVFMLWFIGGLISLYYFLLAQQPNIAIFTGLLLFFGPIFVLFSSCCAGALTYHFRAARMRDVEQTFLSSHGSMRDETISELLKHNKELFPKLLDWVLNEHHERPSPDNIQYHLYKIKLIKLFLTELEDMLKNGTSQISHNPDNKLPPKHKEHFAFFPALGSCISAKSFLAIKQQSLFGQHKNPGRLRSSGNTNSEEFKPLLELDDYSSNRHSL